MNKIEKIRLVPSGYKAVIAPVASWKQLEGLPHDLKERVMHELESHVKNPEYLDTQLCMKIGFDGESAKLSVIVDTYYNNMPIPNTIEIFSDADGITRDFICDMLVNVRDCTMLIGKLGIETNALTTKES